MADIKAFRGFRPRAELVERVAALPYDVYSRKEAKAEVEREPLSFLRVDRAETQFGDEVDMYSTAVYEKARELLDTMIQDGIYLQEEKEVYYIYELTMEGRTQTGIVACASIDDYQNNRIKKHENTREEKELDRIRHVDVCNAQTGPIFLAYRAKKQIDEVVEQQKKKPPVYRFVSPDGIGHAVWVMDAEEDIRRIQESFRQIDCIYIADGHHRAASAVKVGLKRRAEHPGYSGTEEFNYFLSVLFPHDQLMIMPYNRVIRDLNGMTEEEFLSRLKADFEIEEQSAPVSPVRKGTFGMYLNQKWYCLQAHADICREDPVEGLDVSILQREVFEKLLHISDPRTDQRIDFVGGIRGLQELERRAKDDMCLAFSMYPTSILELFGVSDADRLMPPKSTWFEPKLRSGIFIHQL
ncbi:MAG: DUF1015 family protein [Bacteroides sp.]|nr:DUF1015 family protein [Bacteroides sp.]MCM1550695.1 DUF1015 family protein [Clostridium sp.]